MTAGPAAALGAPLAIATVTALAWGFFGPAAALVVLSILAAAIVAFHLWNQHQVRRWASGSLDAPVPEGRGSWREVFTALHRRMRTREEYQRDLRLTIDRFRLAAEAIPDGVIVLDERDQIAWANPRACETLGLDLQKDRGAPIVNLVRQPEFLAYVEAGNYAESVTVTTPGALRRTLSLQLVPFGAREKLLLAHDVTQLEAVARMRRDFIANVSHELKTPLTVIAGFVETMQDLDLDARGRARYLGLMAEQARSMQRLVNDLLTLSALEGEHNPVADERFAVLPLLLAASAEGKALSGGRHAVELDLGSPALLTGDRDEIAGALSNLVSNAIRYTPEGGSVTIAWRVESSGVGVLSVTDTGIGIAAEHLPRLTERFYRVDRSRSRATGGTGLGLAIVRHVLLRHQGELRVDSAPGRGSTFSMRLPARRVHPELPGAGPAADPAATSTSSPRGTGS
ncbi:MAG: phosphate regulon sensor histidine kinase PhoR [Burkholderiales bacterium]|nr:phosphate regulon sensor histidine kinase PhoR [Burkholderiales bacterium]MCE7877126.1 phosphate regulon sensor histidine kinase PhoR [Betaproteobacteria bacterium PRO3]